MKDGGCLCSCAGCNNEAVSGKPAVHCHNTGQGCNQ